MHCSTCSGSIARFHVRQDSLDPIRDRGDISGVDFGDFSDYR